MQEIILMINFEIFVFAELNCVCRIFCVHVWNAQKSSNYDVENMFIYPPGQVQGFVNSLADLRGMLAAVERINTVICSAEVDEWLAHGLEREARGELQSSDECANISDTGDAASINNGATIPIMSEFQKSVCELAWSGDVVLESKSFEASRVGWNHFSITVNAVCATLFPSTSLFLKSSLNIFWVYRCLFCVSSTTRGIYSERHHTPSQT